MDVSACRMSEQQTQVPIRFVDILYVSPAGRTTKSTEGTDTDRFDKIAHTILKAVNMDDQRRVAWDI